ncbi:MAG TPA: sugar phosphate nucleotidyltransferase [Coriobacteriia bacterium]|jgi:mannose-1-phosphate guanylyltransferase/phosphomannomutase
MKNGAAGVRAVIMAGGEGTRLRPLTSMRPKPMVPIVNKPVMEHILGLVKWHGVREVVATLQFMPQVIEDYFGDGEEWGMEMTYAVEERPLGTAGSVKNAEELLTGTFIVISGDALTDIDLSEVVRVHREKGGIVTIALKRVDNPLEFGVVITGEDGRIERFLEKPTWGQVFSDTINTGIYVMEPAVFDYIPRGKTFDFSSELFPLLMREGHELYGAVMDGYWCDIGSLGTYMQAHVDVLDGKVGVYVPGYRTKDDVWVGDGATIDPSARVAGKVVIGSNCKIKAGAELGEYTVLGDNCLVGYDARVHRSVVWNDSFIGARAVLRGTVIGRDVDVRANATVESGSAVGDSTSVGAGAVVGNEVQVYPFKRIEPAAVVSSSLIWESRAGSALFGPDGIAGYVGVDITPALALRVAQAFGTTLPTGSQICVSRDSSRSARMLKRAMVAGLNATGMNVRDLRVASPAVTRFTTRDTRSLGGVHVCAADDDVQTVEIHIFDKQGLEVPVSTEKKIERLYMRQEFRRCSFDEVGEIIYPARAMEYYSAGLIDALGNRDDGDERTLRLVADMGFGVGSLVMPQIGGAMRLELIALSPFADAERTYVTPEERRISVERLRSTVTSFQADLGAAIDASGEHLTLVTSDGDLLDGDTALHAVLRLWCEADDSGLPVAVPLTASRVVERIAAETGHSVVRTPRSPRALCAAATVDEVGFAGSQIGGFVFPSFLSTFDAVMSIGMITRLLLDSGKRLDDVVAELPPFFLREASLFCPYDKKGLVMRGVAEAFAGLRVEMTDGIRAEVGEGWVLVLPHSTEPVVKLFVEGADDAEADELLGRYSDLVGDLLKTS